MLHIHNSLTKTKEPFIPIEPGKVRLYVCGMTVYDYCHLGHARVLVVFDTVVRYLRALGYQVTYVRNITDIDDKIIRRAHENHETIGALTARFIQAMNEDADKLGVLRPDHEPRATEHIGEIVAMIGSLMAKDYAYQAGNGDIYYAVSRFKGYGKLSGRHLDELRVGARVEPDEAKRDPLDFVLWKSAKPDEPSWASPWGKGRPGWHIECSAMSTHCLGEHFDIHGGGMDLQFPHHENEIAQSEAATGRKFVNVWMHNGFVRVADEKMSKSLGNFFTVREVLTRYRPEEIRYFILASHYRSPLSYSEENLQLARSELTRFYTALRGLPSMGEDNSVRSEELEVRSNTSRLTPHASRFYSAMDDDFNTREAIAVLFDMVREINSHKSHDSIAKAAPLAAELRKLAGILGLLQEEPEAYLQGPAERVLNVEEMIAQRNAARETKNWAESDRIRDLLKANRIILEDGPHGTTWRRE
ncbi:MAG: cysteine--tRNA ligase [Gammaproteobacteria bacterium]|nr:cysteine--tRNA ligase [Gammaproteobacteria bacterium]